MHRSVSKQDEKNWKARFEEERRQDEAEQREEDRRYTEEIKQACEETDKFDSLFPEKDFPRYKPGLDDCCLGEESVGGRSWCPVGKVANMRNVPNQENENPRKYSECGNYCRGDCEDDDICF